MFVCVKVSSASNCLNFLSVESKNASIDATLGNLISASTNRGSPIIASQPLESHGIESKLESHGNEQAECHGNEQGADNNK